LQQIVDEQAEEAVDVAAHEPAVFHGTVIPSRSILFGKSLSKGRPELPLSSLKVLKNGNPLLAVTLQIIPLRIPC
jgi:hypothetical protein